MSTASSAREPRQPRADRGAPRRRANAAAAESAEARFIGQLLDTVIREQEGPALLAIFEEIRDLASALRRNYSATEERKLRRRIARLSLAECVPVARGFALFFQLLNLCEERHAGPARERELKRGGFAGLFARLVRRGFRAEQVEEALARNRTTVVLTAHPTEATRWTVHKTLRRIDALLDATARSPGEDCEAALLREITGLWQTHLQRVRPPTPLDEVEQALHRLGTVFFAAIPATHRRLERAFRAVFGRDPAGAPRPARVASWIGGDRDGNPKVTAWVTREALRLYRRTALRNYRDSLPLLIDELTSSLLEVPAATALRESIRRDLELLPELASVYGEHEAHEPYRRKLEAIALRLERTLAEMDGPELRGALRGPSELRQTLDLLDRSLRAHRGSRLADSALRTLREQVDHFGFHLVSLDVRQHEARHRAAVEALLSPATGTLSKLPLREQERFLEASFIAQDRDIAAPPAGLSAEAAEVLATLRAVREAQQRDHAPAVRDLVISNTTHHAQVLELLVLARHVGLVRRRPDGSYESDVNLVPLFESVPALQSSHESMGHLYQSPAYRQQLRARGFRQQVMIGYSDSTKDGGYFAACFALQLAQRRLADQARDRDIHLEFFHGRGGTIGRGGGPSHRAILAQPPESVGERIKLTEQGEVIANKYDTVETAVYHLELLVSATLEASLAPAARRPHPSWLATMEELADRSRQAYRDLVYETEHFVPLFHAITPIDEIRNLQLGSRPARRGGGGRIEELRAIPWNFAWNQNRLLLSSWYGAGSALGAVLAQEGGRERLRAMYRGWLFFRTVIDNLEHVLSKADIHIGMSYGELAREVPGAPRILARIRREHAATSRGALAVVGARRMLEGDPALRRSIERRAPYIDSLSYLQLELLKRRRAAGHGERSDLSSAVQLTINGIAAGLRNTG